MTLRSIDRIFLDQHLGQVEKDVVIRFQSMVGYLKRAALFLIQWNFLSMGKAPAV